MKNTSIESRRSVLSMAIAGLRLCGIWSLDSSSPIFLKLLHNISNIFGIITLIIFVGTLTIDLILNSNDLLIATDDGCYLAGISVIVFKVYEFHRQHKRIKNLTDATYQPIYVFWKSTDTGVKTVLKTNKFYEDLGFKFFVSLGGFLVIALIFFVPTEEGALPIRGAYPFNTTISPMHEVAFCLQIYAVTYGLMAILMMDTVGLGIMRWLNVQCIILASNYRNCRANQNNSFYLESRDLSKIASIEDDNNNVTDIYDEPDSNITTFCPFDEQDPAGMSDCFIGRFKRCIKNHQRLLNTIDELNACFSSCMLMQLFASFSMICLTGFQAVLGATTKTSLIKFVLYLGAAFSQLLYWCWFGNELLYEKVTLLTSQWTSGWENELDSNIQPLLIVSMIKTMRPLELHAGAFFIMSMETFISIIKSSYSFFALLTTMTD
nr:olfactory receptor [Microplitis mediator]